MLRTMATSLKVVIIPTDRIEFYLNEIAITQDTRLGLFCFFS